MNQRCTPLITHINKIEGQLASIKRELESEDPDCIQASRTLYSLSRSFAGLRLTFIETFISNYTTFKKGTKDTSAEIQELLKLIKG
jgi:DNA-binding FrmR family transcriptional regulator